MSVQSQERGEEIRTTLFIFAMNDDGSATGYENENRHAEGGDMDRDVG